MAGIRWSLSGGSLEGVRCIGGVIEYRINGPGTARVRLARAVTLPALGNTGDSFTITSSGGGGGGLQTRFVGHVQLPSSGIDPGAEIQELVIVDRWVRELDQHVLVADTPWGVDTRVLLGGVLADYESDDVEENPIDPDDAYFFEGFRVEADSSLTESVQRIMSGVSGSKSISLPGAKMIPTFVDGLARSQALRQALRWLGGAVAYFDANGAFHANADSSDYSVHVSECSRGGVQLAKRSDLAVPGVRIILRKWQESNYGRKRLENVIEQAGSPDAPGGVITALDLSPERHSLTVSNVRVREVEAGSLSWWAKVVPEVARAGGETGFVGPESVTVRRLRKLREGENEPGAEEGGEVEDDDITHEIVSGSIPATFCDVGCDGPYGRRIKILTSTNTKTAKVGRILVEGTFVFGPGRRPVRLRYTANATNLDASGRYAYEDKTAKDVGELANDFAGLAEAYLTTVNKSQWQGTVTLAPTANGSVPVAPIGRLLRVTGGPSEWATMSARISAVSQDIEARTTTITVGPSPGVELGDLIERIRAFRDAKVRPPRLIDVEGDEYRGSVEPLSSSPADSPYNAGSERQPDEGPFALNALELSLIVVNPSTVYDHVPNGMDPVEGIQISAGASSGVVWIQVDNGGASPGDINFGFGSDWPEEPAGSRIYKIGAWQRAINPATGVMELQTRTLRYGPIEQSSSGSGSTSPFEVEVRVKPGTESSPAYEARVLPGLLLDGLDLSSAVAVTGVDEWFDIVDGDFVFLEIVGGLSSFIIESATIMHAAEEPDPATIDPETDFQTHARRVIGAIEADELGVLRAKQVTTTNLLMQNTCYNGNGIRWPFAF